MFIAANKEVVPFQGRSVVFNFDIIIPSNYLPQCMNRLFSLAVCIVPVIAVLLLAPSQMEAAPTPPKSYFQLSVSAVDLNGNPLPNLVAGNYARLTVKALVDKVPNTAAVLLSAKATFVTIFMGRKISYSIALPAQGAANSTLNTSVGMPGSGQKFGTEYEKKQIEEVYDFLLPAETPAGTLKVTVLATATSIPKFSKTFSFTVVRP